FSRDGSRLASASPDGDLRLWDALNGRYLGKLGVQLGGYEALEFAEDGKTLFAATNFGVLHAWDLAARENRKMLGADNIESAPAALCAEGPWVAWAVERSRIQIWSGNYAQKLLEIPAGKHLVSVLAASADGRLLAAGSDSGDVLLWEVSTGAP